MSSFQSEVFEALRSIDIPEDKALKAAVALSRRDDDIHALRTDVRLLVWMVGALTTVMALVGAPSVWVLIKVAFKTGVFT